MAQETADNQRPVVIAAVILAALTAAGLWYFFVFRQEDKMEVAMPTSDAVTELAEGPAARLSEATPTPAPSVSPVPPSAETGVSEFVIGSALVALFASGLIGRLRHRHGIG